MLTPQHISDATIEAFHHAVGFRGARLRQAVLNAKGLALLVKGLISRWLTFTIGKQAIGELFAVVGQHLGNLDGARFMRLLEEGTRTDSGLVELALSGWHGRLPRTSATLGFVLHLRQVFDVDMDITRFVRLECLVCWLGLFGPQLAEVVHTLAAQAAIQLGA